MLEVHSITKHFPGTTALDDVSLSIRPGEVLALAGENGSGKSTLMKILAGHIRPSEGRLAANGETLKFASPTDSVSARIGFVEQELAVAPHLTVAENILLGRLPRLRFLPGMIDWKAVWRKAQEVMNLLEIDVSPRAIVGQLPLNLQQLISIASVLSRDPRIILLDEATSSLSEDETQHLLRIVRNLRDQGIGIVFISHRMPEMREIADRIVVLRDGRVSGYADMADVSDAEIVRMLVGRDIDDIYPPLSAPTEEMVLQVHGLGTRGFLRDISLSVRSGEIVGLAGLVGSGRSTLAQALFGALPPDTGHIELKGQKVRFRHPRHALAAGVGFVGENRKTQGILRGRSVSENISITALESYARLGLLRPRKEQQDVAESVQKMSIKCHSTSASIEGLSGGNQQKALLARALTNDPRLLILDEPTRGVDVGAKSEIYSQIAAGAAEGRSFLVASSEIPELLGICHRIYVMSQGQIVGCLDGAQATEEHIARLAFHTSEEMEAV